MQKTEFRGTLRQQKVRPTPASEPSMIRHELRIHPDTKKAHVAFYTLKMTYFAFGETHYGEMWTKSDMPIIMLYWSTPSSKTYGKESVSDQIFTKEEYDNYTEWFGGENTPLGRHFIKFKEKHFEEWDKNKIKWCAHHIRKMGIIPAYAEPYIVKLALDHIEKFG